MRWSELSPRAVPTRLGRWVVRVLGRPGTPLVLWPSLFTDHRLYRRVVALLDDDWAPVLIDGPGFGESDPPRGRVQPEQYAAGVLDVFDTLGLNQAVVGGTSWGGQIAAHLAASRPDRVCGALLMNTPLSASRQGNRGIVTGAVTIGPTRLFAAGVARAMLAPGSRSDPGTVAEFVAAFPSFRRRPMARTADTTLRHFPGLESVLADIQVPTTILMGELDRLYPPSDARGVVPANPCLRVVTVPACGHLAPLEAPGAVVAELLAHR